jgi:hypothetical protein
MRKKPFDFFVLFVLLLAIIVQTAPAAQPPAKVS